MIVFETPALFLLKCSKQNIASFSVSFLLTHLNFQKIKYCSKRHLVTHVPIFTLFFILET